MLSDTSEVSWVTAHPARDASMGRRRPAISPSAPWAADDSEEATLLDHQRYHAALRLQQIGGRLRHFVGQAFKVVPGEQGAGQMAEPLELAVPLVGMAQGVLERNLLAREPALSCAER